MSKTRVQMIIETLRDNPTKKFTARDLTAEVSGQCCIALLTSTLQAD